MSGGISATTVAGVMSAAGAVAGATGAIMSAQSQSAAADYQAKVAANNAITAQNNATYARQSGAVQEEQSRMKTDALIGNQRASEASNGFDVNTGSNVDLQAGTAMSGEIDAQTIKSNAAWRAYGFQVQSSNATADSSMYSATASNATTAGAVDALGNIIGGAKSLSDKWDKMFSSSGGIIANASPTTSLRAYMQGTGQ